MYNFDYEAIHQNTYLRIIYGAELDSLLKFRILWIMWISSNILSGQRVLAPL